MPLDSKDIEHIHHNVIGPEVPVYALDCLAMFKGYQHDPMKIKKYMEIKIDHIKKELLTKDGWVDTRLENELPTKEALYRVLFCPLENVPLCINDMFSEIAKWRLENSV